MCTRILERAIKLSRNSGNGRGAGRADIEDSMLLTQLGYIQMMQGEKFYSQLVLRYSILKKNLNSFHDLITYHVYMFEGPSQYEAAMTSFQEAARKDHSSVKALEGMIMCQLYEGLYDDAEGQIELLLVMHSPEVWFANASSWHYSCL